MRFLAVLVAMAILPAFAFQGNQPLQILFNTSSVVQSDVNFVLRSIQVEGGVPPYHFRMLQGVYWPGAVLLTGGAAFGDLDSWASSEIEVMDSVGAREARRFSIGSGPQASRLYWNRYQSWPVGRRVQQQMMLLGADECSPPNVTANVSSLPPGLSMSNRGWLFGTPTQPGKYRIVVNVHCEQTNPPNHEAAWNYEVLDSKPTFHLNAGKYGVVGKPFETKIEPIGVAEPFQYALALGNIPTGLQLSADGTLKGNPMFSGTYRFQVRATDRQGKQYLEEIEVFISPGGILVEVPDVLPEAQVGRPYRYELKARTSDAQAAAMRIRPEIPGLTIRDGVLEGTPTEVGTYEPALHVEHPSRPVEFVRRPVRIHIRQAQPSRTPLPRWAHLPTATVGANYSQNLNIQGGSVFTSHPEDPMPPGFSMSSTGQVAGTPRLAGYYAFRVRVDGGQGLVVATLLVTPPGPRLANRGELPRLLRNQVEGVPIEIEGGVPPYTLELGEAFHLPRSVMRLSVNGAGQWYFHYPIDRSHVAGIPVRIKDSKGTETSGVLQVQVVESMDAPRLDLSGMGPGTVGTDYEGQLRVSGGTPPYKLERYDPEYAYANLDFAVTPDGKVIGRPKHAGLLPFWIAIVDSGGLRVIERVLIEVGNARLPLGAPTGRLELTSNLNEEFVNRTGIGGGQGRVQYRLRSGVLPSGLRLAADGVIEGRAVMPGTSTVVVEATDVVGTVTSREVRIDVPTPAYLARGSVGVPYDVPLGIPGLMPASLRGLPPGIVLSADGRLRGVPSVAGEFVFAAAGRSMAIVVGSPAGLQIATRVLVAGVAGRAMTQALRLNENVAAQFRVSAGRLVPGVELTPEGLLRGTPIGAGRFEFSVTATDGGGRTAARHFELVVVDASEPALLTLVNSGSYAADGVAPGELLTGFGQGIGPAQLVTLTLDANRRVSTELGGTRVIANGKALPLVYASTGQTSAIAPWNEAAEPLLWFAVERGGVQTTAVRIPTVDAKPGFFTGEASSIGAAAPGEVAVAYLTGAGLLQVPGLPGAIAGGINRTVLQPTVTVCGQTAEVLYSGAAPGLAEGVSQLNFRIPNSAPSGACALRVRFGEQESAAGVTVQVRP